MCEVPVFYATTEGQTRRIAERIAECLRARGLESRAIDVSSADADRHDWTRMRGACLGASLHAGTHQRAAAAFVRAHRAMLNGRPSAFFSVSLSAASKNDAERIVASRLAHAFAADAGWTPATIVCIGGRLAYTQYGWLKRLMMRWIAKKEGGPIDSRRDHELTDWSAVTAFAEEFAYKVLHTTAGQIPAASDAGPSSG